MAGTESSGGGPSVYCANASNPDGIAQMYDFFEGRVRYGLNIPTTNSLSKEALIEAALTKLEIINYGIAQDVKSEYENLTKQIKFLPDGILMGPVTDLGNAEAALTPVGCQIVYAGYVEQSGRLSISKNIFKHFTETDKAGLLLHEAIYSLARKATTQDNSRSTRILNSFLFSDEVHPSPLVLESLSTLNLFNARKTDEVFSLRKQDNANNITFKSYCSVATGDDRLDWGSLPVAFWSSPMGDSYTFIGSKDIGRLKIDSTTPFQTEVSFSFVADTKLILISRLSASYASGNCASSVIEIYYSGKKIGSIPPLRNGFVIRVF